MRSGVANLTFWPWPWTCFWNSSSVAVEYQYLFEGRKVFEYQTETDLLNLELKIRVRKIEDPMLYYGCKDSGLLCWKLNKVAVVFYFLKVYWSVWVIDRFKLFYTEESIPCTNFRVCVTPFACTLRAQFVKAWKVLPLSPKTHFL